MHYEKARTIPLRLVHARRDPTTPAPLPKRCRACRRYIDDGRDPADPARCVWCAARDYTPAAAELPRFYATEHQPPEEKVCRVKLFMPDGAWTWYLIEYDPDVDQAFAFVVGHQEAELGYVDLPELRELRSPLGIYVERDLDYTPESLATVQERHSR